MLFNIDIPVNSYNVMELTLKFCAMDFFQTEIAFEAIFDFRETKVFNEVNNERGEGYSKYAEAGYDSSNFFLLLGPLFFIAIFYGVYLALKKLLKLATRTCSDNFFTRKIRKSEQIMIFLTRFLLEGCIEIGLSAIITVLMLEKENFDDFWEAVSTIFAFVSLLALALAPIYFHRITRQYLQSKLDSSPASKPKKGKKKKKKFKKKANDEER